MKRTGRLLQIVLCTAAMFLAAASQKPVSAKEAGIASLAVAPFPEASEDPDLVYWYQSVSGTYYLFLPAETDLNTARVFYSASDTAVLDGTDIPSGQTASAFTPGEHTLSCGGEEYPLTVCLSADIPAMFIITRSGTLDYIHEDKEHREPAAVRLYENGKLTLDKDLTFMKARGNGSFLGQKKPYSIKFKKKTNLLGMGSFRKWTLLASRSDRSLLRDVYGWEFAKAFGLQYTSQYRHVDLYVNGDYRGTYIACEKVEVGPGLIEIRDLEKENERVNRGIDLESLPVVGTGEDGSPPPGQVKDSAKWVDLPNEPEDISGGYLLEFKFANRYVDDPCGFVTESGHTIAIREPEFAGRLETAYIRSVVNDAFNALYAPNGINEDGSHYSECFDFDSFVNMYILQELSNNIDAGLNSLFLLKDSGSEKLVFAPIWDMDHAFGNRYPRLGANIGTPDIWWANSIGFPYPTVFTTAYRREDFREAVRARWKQLLEENILTAVLEKAHAASLELEASGIMNVLRWDEEADWSNAGGRYRWWVSHGEEFLDARIQALTKGFSEESAMLYYDANGGSGYAFNREILLVGEMAEVSEDGNEDLGPLKPPAEGLEFAGWNTSPDGSGETYQPGESIVLKTPVTVLYAKWEQT